MVNQDDFALLLAFLGGTYLLTALIGKVTGDAARDVRLMAGVGVTLGVLAATLLVL